MSDDQIVQRVRALAHEDPEAARQFALCIEDPWGRAYYLSHVSIGLEDLETRVSTVRAAFAVARLCKGPNRQVDASSYALAALAELGDEAALVTKTHRLLELAATEPSPVRRAHAIDSVARAVIRHSWPLFLEVFAKLREACLSPLKQGKRNKRGQSRLAIWIVVIHGIDPVFAMDVFEDITGPSIRKRTLNDIAGNGPRYDLDTMSLHLGLPRPGIDFNPSDWGLGDFATD